MQSDSHRRYWSQRQGHTPGLNTAQASRLVSSVLDELGRRGYLDEWFGFMCVDLGDVPGLAGEDRASFVSRRTFRDDLWPSKEQFISWDASALFTAIEFYHDHVSKPLHGDYHSYSDCGMHWSNFDADAGRVEFRAEINRLLLDYEDGYEVNPRGEVQQRSPLGMDSLLQAVPPALPGKDYLTKVDLAVSRFRSRSSSLDDRMTAVRDLADVLEYLRPEMRSVITKKDDAALFEIANRFAIRHMDDRQFGDYDRAIWLSWMFYFYLATINAATRFIARTQQT